MLTDSASQSIILVTFADHDDWNSENLSSNFLFVAKHFFLGK